jgi:hypothetical protein
MTTPGNKTNASNEEAASEELQMRIPTEIIFVDFGFHNTQLEAIRCHSRNFNLIVFRSD